MKAVPSPQALRFLQHLAQGRSPATRPRAYPPFLRMSRHFHAATRLDRTETHTLSDIGEGVKEVQIIQWFVEEGAPIEEWSPLCEVQSDKASVEITSKYSGIIKKIHFPQDAVVQVGDGMVDIEVEGDAEPQESAEQETHQDPGRTADEEQVLEGGRGTALEEPTSPPEKPKIPSKHASLATPAVRGLLKEHGIAIEDITGTGKEGRVLKEDVYKYLEQASTQTSRTEAAPSKPGLEAKQTETAQRLTPVQAAMFKSMTGSLSIPHFLYSDTIDITGLAAIRTRLNTARNPETTPKFSYLPFIVKAVSLALTQYPLLNARLDLATDPKKPQLMMRSVHNIGIAMDTPNGLIVPVVKAVNARSITSIAQEIQRLARLGQAGKLSNSDLTGGTITVSNIGNIGGEVVAPVIVEGQLAIMGVGKIKTIPVFADDGVTVRPAQTVNLSWSADHRVVDGATMARMAQVVQKYLEEPGTMIVDMS
ncbi:Lipoamide acyltransferase component of branched-chain alpha-keto acid dehydrogenase complex, mitochondrial [Cladophialophora carrionii]|uniref:Dihydrolipoamide acetyltransferase component of pyruvate dehydrogenase complex n=1 Tax=Cladophialophora carrionii TaxID=86049 RepID=A0A1C1CTW0_9EURO|nr:Lipoamide acyltransferase component of branched-chain alpha-keto acid dehydrogenase complex, mitochondrial [Cladophialophora carrionii]